VLHGIFQGREKRDLAHVGVRELYEERGCRDAFDLPRDHLCDRLFYHPEMGQNPKTPPKEGQKRLNQRFIQLGHN
jgi:hypothetical protein